MTTDQLVTKTRALLLRTEENTLQRRIEAARKAHKASAHLLDRLKRVKTMMLAEGV